jgi:ketosteroid isomerase-like protein
LRARGGARNTSEVIKETLMRTLILLPAIALLLVGCAPSIDVEQERAALMSTDREWAQTTTDPDKFVSFYAEDASFYVGGLPVVKGRAAIRGLMGQIMSAPDFALRVASTDTQVGAAGDIGYITGTYELTQGGSVEKGKSVTVWRKQPDGAWRVVHDIFNADEPAAPGVPPPGPHTLLTPNQVAWGEAPPNLPPGGKIAVISGDPTMPGPFVLRAELPAGYTIAPHWHPTDEHVTVLAGTFAFGMGDTLDPAAMQDLPAGGYALMPAEMRHYAMAKTATTLQIHSMGPLVFNYVNPADDPSRR